MVLQLFHPQLKLLTDFVHQVVVLPVVELVVDVLAKLMNFDEPLEVWVIA